MKLPLFAQDLLELFLQKDGQQNSKFENNKLYCDTPHYVDWIDVKRVNQNLTFVYISLILRTIWLHISDRQVPDVDELVEESLGELSGEPSGEPTGDVVGPLAAAPS